MMVNGKMIYNMEKVLKNELMAHFLKVNILIFLIYINLIFFDKFYLEKILNFKYINNLIFN